MIVVGGLFLDVIGYFKQIIIIGWIRFYWSGGKVIISFGIVVWESVLLEVGFIGSFVNGYIVLWVFCVFLVFYCCLFLFSFCWQMFVSLFCVGCGIFLGNMYYWMIYLVGDVIGGIFWMMLIGINCLLLLL